jgi:hypothetical protein
MVLSTICNMSSAAAVSQRLKQKVPGVSLAPAAELLPHGVPFAEHRRQVAPRRSGPANPEYAVQSVPMVLGRTPATRAGGRQQGARRSPTLRPSSVRGSQSASSLPRGWSRLIASRSIESLDAKKKRNESPDGTYDSSRYPPRRSLVLCFPIWSADQLVTAVATRVSRRPSRSDSAGARTGLSTGPSYLPAIAILRAISSNKSWNGLSDLGSRPWGPQK